MPGTPNPYTKRCRWCRELFVLATAWERRYALPVCLECRMGDRVARKADGAMMPIGRLATTSLTHSCTQPWQRTGAHWARGRYAP